MRRLAITLLIVTLISCTSQVPSEQKIKEYSSTAVSLSDFSMKIFAHYGALNLPIPHDFNAKQFFSLLGEIYPDQTRVNFVKNNYKVLVRPLVSKGYSVMLCDPKTDNKIMEDFSCHLNRVEIQSWESNEHHQCSFESNWKSYCE
jgi:hypothetical protein